MEVTSDPIILEVYAEKDIDDYLSKIEEKYKKDVDFGVDEHADRFILSKNDHHFKIK